MQTEIGAFIGHQVAGDIRFIAHYEGLGITGQFLDRICSAIDEKISPVKKYIPCWVISGVSFIAAQGVGRYAYRITYSAMENTAINRIKNDFLYDGLIPKGLLILGSAAVMQPVVPCLLAGGSILLVGGIAMACMLKHRTVSNYFFPNL